MAYIRKIEARLIEYIKIDLLACDLFFFNSGRAGPLNTKTITTLPGVFLTCFHHLPTLHTVFFDLAYFHASHLFSPFFTAHSCTPLFPPRLILRTPSIFSAVSSSPLICITVVSLSFCFYTKSLLSPRFAKTITPLFNIHRYTIPD